jgi:asparagine synthase (glutamine-hydrolysing)
MERVLASSGVSFHKPFLDPAFVGAFAAEGGVVGFLTRTEMMRRLFGDVVPDEICARQDKGRFGAVAVGRESRAFLSKWDGSGIGPDYVDVEAFRRACAEEIPVFGTQLLLQSAWPATNGDATKAGQPAISGSRSVPAP